MQRCALPASCHAPHRPKARQQQRSANEHGAAIGHCGGGIALGAHPAITKCARTLAAVVARVGVRQVAGGRRVRCRRGACWRWGGGRCCGGRGGCCVGDGRGCGECDASGKVTYSGRRTDNAGRADLGQAEAAEAATEAGLALATWWGATSPDVPALARVPANSRTITSPTSRTPLITEAGYYKIRRGSKAARLSAPGAMFQTNRRRLAQ